MIRVIITFLGGLLIACLGFFALLKFIEDKPVPNAVFSQSIIDAKLSSARSFASTPKTVVVGGSNVLFGIDSQLLGELTGRRVLNFGCAAGFGPELILHLLKPHLHSGDSVIMRWEYHQYLFTRSGTVNLTYLNLLTSTQNEFMRELPIYDRTRLCLSIPVSLCWEGVQTAYNPFVDTDLYRCSWAIDSMGNVRSNLGVKINDSEMGYDFFDPNSSFKITTDVDDIFSDFVKFCRQKKISFIVSWPNVAFQDAHAHPLVQKKIENIIEFWRDLGVVVLGRPDNYMFKKHDLYDTVYHLNQQGVRKCTKLLADDLADWFSGSVGN